MKRTAKQRLAAADPLLRACDACGADKGQGCNTTGKNGQPIPRITRGSRLVHAARLEGATDA